MARSELVLFLLSVAGCGADGARSPLGAQCELNSQCDTPLVCRLGFCRNECRAPRDCTAGLSCVLDGDGLGACQLPAERSCALPTDCPAPLVCRGQCVNACVEEGSSRDCPPGAVCTAALGELGCIDDAVRACVYHGDCLGAGPGGSDLACVEGRCREECRYDRDCRNGFTCVAPGMCIPPDGGP